MTKIEGLPQNSSRLLSESDPELADHGGPKFFPAVDGPPLQVRERPEATGRHQLSNVRRCTPALDGIQAGPGHLSVHDHRTQAGTERDGPRTATASPGSPRVRRGARARTVPVRAHRAIRRDVEMRPRFEPQVPSRASEARPTIRRRRAGWWAARRLKSRGLT